MRDYVPGGWIGIGFDGTLAEWAIPPQVGQPIPAMIDRVKRFLGEGRLVKVVTARIATADLDANMEAVKAIGDWCEKHIGVRLPLLGIDPHMIGFYDHCAFRVAHNKGTLTGDWGLPGDGRQHGPGRAPAGVV